MILQEEKDEFLHAFLMKMKKGLFKW